MKQLLIAILLVCAAFQIGCTGNRGSTTEAAREPNATLSNADLKNMVEAKINSDAELNAANISVDADADRNMVTLSGEVDSEELRSRAAVLARSAHPALNVENNIDIEQKKEMTREEYTPELAKKERDRAKAYKESIGDSIDDAWIHAKIVTKLIGDPDTPERKINVDVKNNVVTLRGVVDTAAEKAEAERIAKETDGVKRVNNQLKVK